METNAGIHCGHKSLREKRLEDVLPIVEALYNESFILGDNVGMVPLTCASWLIDAKERYEGGFDDIRTKNPLLFIGNTFDPLTPLVSAMNASAGFVGSVVLQHDGYGVRPSHVSQPSPFRVLPGTNTEASTVLKIAYIPRAAIALPCESCPCVLRQRHLA